MRTRSRQRRAVIAAVTTAGALAALLVLPAQLAAAAPTPQPSASGGAAKSGAGDRLAGVPKKALQTFGIGPARSSGLDSRSNFVYAAKPGTTVEDHVGLVNYTTKPIKATVYAQDAFTGSDGSFGVLEAKQTAKDLGSWVTLDARDVTIPARKSLTSPPGTKVVGFTVTVPASAPAGDHAAAVVVSTRTGASRASSSVVVDRRVGTRLFMRVAGPLDPSLNLANLSVSYDGTPHPVGKGLTRVSYTVRNSGNVVLSARQSVKVDGWFGVGGSQKAPPQEDLVQLLPGAAVNVTVDVKGVLPTFRPSAVVTLVPYQGTAAAPVELPAISASKSFWAIPWTLIAIVAALLLSILGWQLWRRRTRPVGSHRAPDPAPELVGSR